MIFDNRAFGALVAFQQGVVSRDQALDGGLTRGALRHRIRTDGPWQRMLPGVYVTVTGRATREQMQIAALLYAGADALITGPAALANYGIRGPRTRTVDVLLPAGSRRADAEFVQVHRTWRMPTSVTCDGPVRFAPADRAVADTVRGLIRIEDARAIVASGVQQGRCTIEQLVAELTAGPVRGSARLRSVLAEAIAGRLGVSGAAAGREMAGTAVA